MAELENIIESVMSSPESMSKIMDVVKMFGVDPGKEENVPDKSPVPLPIPEYSTTGFDPAIISKIMELLGDYNAEGDKRIRLFGAIRPYLKDEDGFHIDRAIHIVKLSHVAKSLFRDFLK